MAISIRAAAPASIRAAVPADAAAINALVHAAFAEYRDRLEPGSAALAETEAAIAGQLADHGGFLAEDDGLAVGAVLVRRRPDSLYLGRLAVPPAWRGRGIARLLVAAVEAEAARHGLAAVTLGVRVALPENAAFFRGLGYVETGRSTHAGFAAPTLIDMAKAIRPPAAPAVPAAF